MYRQLRRSSERFGKTISDILNEHQLVLIREIAERNGHEYNLSKASEEFQELALALTQKLNKPTRVDDQEIIDEIGDAKIRIAILEMLFDKKSIQDRIDYKLSRYKEWNDHNTYKKI